MNAFSVVLTHSHGVASDAIDAKAKPGFCDPFETMDEAFDSFIRAFLSNLEPKLVRIH